MAHGHRLEVPLFEGSAHLGGVHGLPPFELECRGLRVHRAQVVEPLAELPVHEAQHGVISMEETARRGVESRGPGTAEDGDPPRGLEEILRELADLPEDRLKGGGPVVDRGHPHGAEDPGVHLHGAREEEYRVFDVHRPREPASRFNPFDPSSPDCEPRRQRIRLQWKRRGTRTDNIPDTFIYFRPNAVRQA